MQPLDGRSDLLANRRAQDGVSGIEAFSDDQPSRDIVGAQQLARYGSEHAKAEPREFIPREVPIAAIDTLRSDRLRVKIGREDAERTVYVRQVRAVLIKLALHLVNDAGQLAALLD
jgi:hypothetical protein